MILILCSWSLTSLDILHNLSVIMKSVTSLLNSIRHTVAHVVVKILQK